jgi:hypothetical protein
MTEIVDLAEAEDKLAQLIDRALTEVRTSSLLGMGHHSCDLYRSKSNQSRACPAE